VKPVSSIMATTLSTCRWNWCTRSFPDHNGLVAHVEEDHIAKADPVKRKDVSLLQRVEDGASLEGPSADFNDLSP
jgi:hypothetical protein